MLIRWNMTPGNCRQKECILAIDDKEEVLNMLKAAGKIVRDIPRLSQNEAYVCLGFSELSHSDHILQQCGTHAAEPNFNHPCWKGISVI
jgi:hypothetical protein